MMLKNMFSIAAAAALLISSAGAALADDPASTAISGGGDADAGKKVFNQCRACHNLTNDRPHKLGPNLGGLFGRTAGSAEDFTRYSKALKEAGFVWTEEQLDQWLANPRTFLPGNKMSFPGLRQEQQRKDLMAYLRQAFSDGASE